MTDRLHRLRRPTATLVSLTMIFTTFIAGLNISPAAAGLFDVFEMDGNAIDNPVSPQKDFETVYYDFIGGTSNAGANTYSFIQDPAGATDTVFTGGGSKDINDITSWQWTNGSVPDKNELTNAYAATYVSPTGQPLFHLGVDRFSNSGAASFGFWLLQEPIALKSDGTFMNAQTLAPAKHTKGDLLIVTNFGGGTPEVETFRWDAAAAGGPLIKITSASGVNDCGSALSSDSFCGIANAVATPSPWPYTPKAGVPGVFPVDSYLEAVVNVQAALTSGLGCFNTLLAESRSSTLTNAQQKDLAIASSSACGVTVQKQGPPLSKEGDTARYTFTLRNTGVIPLSFSSTSTAPNRIIDNVIGDITPQAIAQGCGTIGAGATCTFNVNWVVPAGFFTTRNPVINIVTAAMAPASGVVTSASTATATHRMELFSPRLAITTAISAGATVVSGTDYVKPGDGLTYTYTVRNNSLNGPTLSAPDLIFADTVTPLNDGYINDTILGALRTAATAAGCNRIATGASCTFSVNHTVVVGNLSGESLTNTVSALYHPEGFPNRITATGAHTAFSQPDLVVSKDDGVASASAGELVTYTVTYQNIGFADAFNVTLTETVPVGTVFNAAGSPGWACADGAPAGTVCTYPVGTVVDGAPSVSVPFRVLVNPVLAAGLNSTSNTVTIADNDARPDANPLNESGSHVTPLIAAPDLVATITDLSGTEVPGTTVTYTVTYDNVGTQDATGSALSMTIPAGTVFNPTNSDPAWSCAPDQAAGSICTLTVGSLPVAPPPTSVLLALDIASAASGSLATTVTVTDDGTNGTDLNAADNSATDTDLLVPSADLSITKSDDIDPVRAGDQLTYTLTVSNGGPSDATGVSVTDSLPSGVTLSSITSSQGGCTALPCSLGTITAGGTATVSVVVDVDSTAVGTITNTASVSAVTADSNNANNTDSEDTLVLNADVGIAKAVDDPTPPEGDTIVYTVTVTNAGPDTASGVEVGDLLPAGVSFVSSDGSYVASTGIWTIGILTSGSSVDLNITATVDAGTSGTVITNSASVSAASPGDLDPSNNADDVAITVNVGPAAQDDAVVTDEDSPVAFDVVADNGSGPDSDSDGTLATGSTTVLSGPTNGTLVNNLDGTFLYTPGANFNGSDSFVYEICDDDGDCAQATVYLTVTPVNDAPVAADNAYDTEEDTAVSGNALTDDTGAGVDADVDTADVLSVDPIPITDVSNGSLVLNADGSFTYTPDADFFGIDSFVYEVCDDGSLQLCDTATVTLAVDANPDAVDDGFAMEEDATLASSVVDIDPGDAPATYSVIGVPPVGLTFNPDGTFSYGPPADFFGVTSFDYQVCDADGDCDMATVTILVDANPDPVDDAVSTFEDVAVSGDVLANDDLGSEPTTVTSYDAVGANGGSIVMAADGTYVYTPPADFFGTDTFTYTVTDADGDTSSAIVTVTVTATPDPVDDAASTFEDVAVSGDVLTNDDLGSEPTTVTSYDAVGTSGGSIVMATDGTFTYTPPADFFGADTFTYTITDANGNASTATVTVTVTATPDAVDDVAATEEDTDVSGDVLANDDLGSEPTTVTSYDAVGTSGGSIVMATDGTFTYTPLADFFGTDTFAYTVSDANGNESTATVTVTVDANPDPVDDAVSTFEDVAVSGDVLANDDLGSEPTAVTSYDAVGTNGGAVVMATDGTFTYTPPADFFGTDTFAYTVSDFNGNTSTATVTVTMTPTPDAVDDTASTFEDSPVTGDVLANDDLGSEPTTVTSYDSVGTNGGSIVMATDGTYTYTPPADFFGTDTFTYTVTDTNGNTSATTVTVAVVATPDAVDDTASTFEDAAVSGDVLANDDLGSEPTMVTGYDGTGSSGGSIAMLSDGTYLYTPVADFSGVDTFTYTVTDSNGNTSTATVTVTVVATPDAVDDANSTLEDSPVTGDVLANDDLGSEPTTVTSYDGVGTSGGTVVMATDGTYTYTPQADFFGTDTFTYTITDANGNTSTATVTVTMTSTPDAVDDIASTEEDTPVSGDVLANDDLGVGPTMVTSYDATGSSGGSITMLADGTYLYTPLADFFGVDTFTYTITDANGHTSTATVTVTVDANPDAVDDTNFTTANTPIGGAVLTNDDLGDLPTTVTGFDAVGTAGGSVAMAPDGTYTYTPPLDFSGTDTFTYTITDNDGDTSTATVSVTVDSQPVAVDDDAVTFEDQMFAGEVFSNDSLGDLPTVVTSYDATGTSGGSIAMSADGTYTYTPFADYSGIDTFTYTITDNDGDTSTATVTVTVVATPDAVDDAVSTFEEAAVSGDVLANDDLGSEPTMVTSYDAVGTSGGSIVMLSDGTYLYTPPADFFGIDTFTYTVTDANGNTSSATVTVTVTATPDAVDDTASTLEDIPVSGDVLANDDLGSEPTTVTSYDATGTNGGTVVMATDGTYTYTPPADFFGTDTFTYTINDANGNTSSATVTVTVTATPDAVDDTAATFEDAPVSGDVLANDDLGSEPTTVTSYDAVGTSGGSIVMLSDGTYLYTPPADFYGTDTFTYTITDTNGNTSSATGTVSVTATPDTVDDTAATFEDAPVSGDALANDDLGSEPTTVTSYDATGTNGGSVVMAADGTYTYTPPADFYGTDTFTYTVTDANGNTSTATVTVTVTAGPDAVADAAATEEDTAVSGDALANDDLGSEPTTVTSYDAVGTNGGTIAMAADGTYTYAPPADFYGTDTFTYTITDANGTTSTATVTVTVDANPDAVYDTNTTDEDTSVSGSVLDNDDLGDEPTTVTAYDGSGMNAGTIVMAPDGTYSYSPPADFFGTDTFTYTITDADGDASTAEVTITVDSVNDAPVATDDTDITSQSVPVTTDVLANDADLEGPLDPTTVSIGDGINSLAQPLNGSVVVNPDGSITYTPNAGYSGPDSYEYEVCDLGVPVLCDVAVVSVSVVANLPPVATDDAYVVDEDASVSGNVVTDDTGNGADSDIDGTIDSASAVLGTDVINGAVVLNPDGTFTYTPDADFNGSDSFTYTVLDDDGAVSNEATVTITVTPVDDLPVATDDVNAVIEDGGPISGDLLANDLGLGDGVASVALVGIPPAGLTLNPDGTYTYTPPVDFNGDAVFTYEVCDVDGDCSQATLTVTVTADPDAPVAVDDAASTLEDVAITFDVTADNGSGPDTDVDGDLDPATVAVGGALLAPTNGGVVANGDGTVTYSPDPDFNGVDAFEYEICDAGGLCDVATVTVTVSAVNDAPVGQPDAVSTNAESTVGFDPLADNGAGADFDVDVADTLTVTSTDTTGTIGSVTLNPDGTISYDPNGQFAALPAGATAADTFTYTVCDDGIPVLCDTVTVTVTVVGVGDEPLALDDSGTTLEDTAITIDVVANDSDPDGDLDPTSVAVDTAPANGTLVFNGDGTITYTPDQDFFGSDSFTYVVYDLTGLSDLATVTVTVDPVEDSPVARDDAAVTDEDVAVIVPVLANDTDPEGNLDPGSLSVSSSGLLAPANGSVVANPDGTVTYTPNPGFFGVDSFEYLVCDLLGNCATATTLVTVNSVNDQPVAADDVVVTLEDVGVVVDVQSNDTDPDGDPLTTTIVSTPSSGTATLNPDGTITYTPDANFSGADSFVYEICDPGLPVLCDQATVFVTVDPVNDAPVANDDAATTDEDLPVVVDLVANDNDVEDTTVDPSTLSVGVPTNGTITAVNADGTVEYTPNPNFFGIDTFTYTVLDSDGAVSNVATVSITVNSINDAPVAQDDSVSTAEDVAVTFDPTVGAGADTDPDGDPLSVSSVTQPANGAVVVNGDGTVTYTPDADFFGTDTFTYTVCDPGLPVLCDSATVTVTVSAVNDAPVARDDADSTEEGFAVTTPVSANDSDVEGGLDLTSVTIVTGPVSGTITAVNPDGSVEYTPTIGFTGTDTYEYSICDLGGLCDTALVTITVTDNTPPIAVDDAVVTGEDTSVTFDPLVDNGLGADSDPDGDPLSVVSVTQPANGSVVLNGDGTVTYTPAADFFGSDTFTYTVCDDGIPPECATATVSMTVDPVNDAPVAGDDLATTDEDVAVTVLVVANDSDTEDGTVVAGSVTIVTGPTNGTITAVNPDGSVEYTPAADFSGTDTFEYQVCDTDGACDVALVTVTVNSVNDAPVGVDDVVVTGEDTSVTFDPLVDNGLGADSDPDGDPLSVVSVTQPANGLVVLNGDGTVTYTPDADFFGSDSFTYTVCDPGGLCDLVTVSMTVDPVNDAPVVINETPVINEDTSVNLDLLANDTDPDGDVVTLTSVDPTGTSGGSIVVEADGTVTYTPPADFVGTDTFTYIVCDPAGLCVTGLVEVDVLAVNDPPVAGGDSVTVDEDSTTTLAVLDNDSDVDGDTLTVISVDTTGTLGTVTINPDGTVDYTPPAGYNGPDSFQYTVCDPGGLCDTATVSVAVSPLPDPPIAGDDAVAATEDTPIVIDVLANDVDADGDALTVVVATQPANGSVTINADGTITYTPDANFTGSDGFTYTVCDPSGLCDVATVTVTVAPVNDAPVAGDDTATSGSGPVVIGVLANDTDIDGDLLTVSSASVPANGTATIRADGTITYTPNLGFSGIDSFTYTVCDPSGACDTAIVTVMVNGTGGLTGRVWLDLNYNGVIDAGETDISGVRLILDYAGPDAVFGTADDQLALMQTWTASPYLFTGLIAGRYRVRVDLATLPSGLYWTYDIDGRFDSQAVAVVVSGSVTPLVNFGYTIGNVAPVAGDDGLVETLEDMSVTIVVLANDADPNGQRLSVVSVTQPANGSVVINNDGTVTYTPNPEYSGPDSFRYTVCETTETPVVGDPEGLCASATVSIFVSAVNDAPIVDPTVLTVAVGSSLPSLTVFDAEGDPFVVVLAGGALPPGVSLNPDGSFSGIPRQVGTFTFIVEVCDTGGACSTSVISIVILPIGSASTTLPFPDDPTPAIPDTLPFTGHNAGTDVVVALMLIIGGMVLLLFTREESSTDAAAEGPPPRDGH